MTRPVTQRNHSYIDQMVIGSGHAMLAGFIPKPVGLEKFSANFYKWVNKDQESLEKFGFFGGDIDYNTYYPNLDPNELQPKDEEFIEPVFRLLSETIVCKSWYPTDFSTPGVLKASMPLLLGQTVNCDHETNIGNAIGSISEVVWQEAYKDHGINIPAGINGVLKIDGKANPRIARGILMSPPSIHSNSVTIQFKWEPSHPDLSRDDFYAKLGTYDDKGNLIRRMVTEIICYRETSLVSHGADPYAQKIGKNGRIVNPRFANQVWNSFSDYEKEREKGELDKVLYAFSDFKDKDNTPLSNNKQEDNNNKNQMELMQFIANLLVGANLLSLEEGKEATEEQVRETLQYLIDNKSKLDQSLEALQNDKESLTAERDTLINKLNATETDLKKAQDQAKLGAEYVESLRSEAVSQYEKLKGDQVDQVILNMIKAPTTDIVTLKSLTNDYKQQLEDKFPLHCAACGSTELTRASSSKEGQEGKNQPVEGDLFKDLYNEKMKVKS